MKPVRSLFLGTNYGGLAVSICICGVMVSADMDTDNANSHWQNCAVFKKWKANQIQEMIDDDEQ